MIYYNMFFINLQKHYPMIMLLKKTFVLSEGLKKIQEIKAAPGSKLR